MIMLCGRRARLLTLETKKMSQQFGPRLAMSSFATDGDLRRTLEQLAAHGIKPADLLLLTRSGDEYRPGARITNGQREMRADASVSVAEMTDPLAPSVQLFSEELKNQIGVHVLFVAIRDRAAEQGVCRILLEHAAEPVLIRDMPHPAEKKKAHNDNKSGAN
jgi:hypothetical protein